MKLRYIARRTCAGWIGGLGLTVFLYLLHVAGGARLEQRTPERDRRALIAIQNEWLNAHNAPALDHILAADFIHPVLTRLFLTKPEHIDWFTKHPPPAD